MLFQGINVVSLYVPDLDAAREFYRDVLGLGAPLYDMPEIGCTSYDPFGNRLQMCSDASGAADTQAKLQA
jgi:hypothetical protein